MSETLLTALITSVTGVVAALISGGSQVLAERVKGPGGSRTFRGMMRSINWVVTVGGMLAAAAVMLIVLLATLPRTQEYSANVTSQCPAFAPTGVTVEKGDDVQVVAQGDDPAWDCGRGPIGPAGYFNEKFPNHFLPSANACELIGYIGQPQVYFRIGGYRRFEAPETGPLYLGINDAKDQCEGNPAEPHLTVKIVVAK